LHDFVILFSLLKTLRTRGRELAVTAALFELLAFVVLALLEF
jgi:hypothetical protein